LSPSSKAYLSSTDGVSPFAGQVMAGGDLMKCPLIDDASRIPPLPGGAARGRALPPISKARAHVHQLGHLILHPLDFIPPAYMEALSRLQTISTVLLRGMEAIVAVEICARLSKAFSEFETKPLAAASLGQVHRSACATGGSLPVTVQRPHVRDAWPRIIDREPMHESRTPAR